MRKLRSENAQRLAAQIALNCKSGTPPVLFIGAGASLKSGLPNTEDFLSQVSTMLGRRIRDLGSLNEALSLEATRKLFILNFVQNQPSKGYRMLSQLIRRKYFTTILTTNWDLALEIELRKWIAPTDLRLFARPHDEDPKIADALSEPGKTNLVRLHGDINTKIIYAPDQLMLLAEPLQGRLSDIIKRNGIVFVGYGLAEPRIINLVDGADIIGYVNPSPAEMTSSLPRRNLIPVTGNQDAYFEEFMEGLTRCLLSDSLRSVTLTTEDTETGREIPDFSSHRPEIDQLIDGLSRLYEENDYSEAAVEQLTIRLFNKIRQRFVKIVLENLCVLFVHDPAAPGGSELRDILERKKMLGGFEVKSIHIEGRGAEVRRVQSGGEDLGGFESIVILDSITFSGNTLNLIKGYLESTYAYDPSQLVAGLMLLSQDAERRLERFGWKTIVKGGEHSGSGLVCPWGVTRPTKPIPPAFSPRTPFGERQVLPASEEFLVSPAFGFIPKPWGDLISFCDNSQTSVRLLTFNRGHRTSLHYHLLRDEIFFVLGDRMRIQLWDRFIVLRKHEAIRVPAGVPHSFIALEHPCNVLEIAEGLYDQKGDIFRLEDVYEREGLGNESNGLI